jgi:hypothetical protein
MSDEPADLTAFTRTLAEAAPHPGHLNRDALLFAAGLAAGRRRRFWPAVAAALALLSAGLGATLLLRAPAVREVDRIVYVQVPAPVPESVRPPTPAPSTPEEPSPLASAPPGAEWIAGLRLRNQVLRDGLSALPTTVWLAPAPGTAETVPDLSALRLNAPSSLRERLP